MQRRPSIPNGYPHRPGTRMLPPNYQPEPIPMMTGPGQSFSQRRPSINYNNSFKHNRVAPPPPSNQMDYSTYSQPYQSFERPTSIISSNNQLIQPSRHPYYQQNNNSYPDDIPEHEKQLTWCSKPLCLGLTRLSGGILFGTMIILSLASIAGLITSVVLYVTDITTDPQWKILGMVVCAIMLLTVLVTLCIFIYCYKKGHIINNVNKNNSLTPQYNPDIDYRHPYNNNRSEMPYGMMRNVSPTSSNNGEIVQVQDKLTNTEATISALRPRDIQRGVWQGNNAYNGLSHRPTEPPKMVNRVVQVLTNEIEPIPSKQKNQVIDIAPTTIIRLPDKRSRRMIENSPQYEIVEEVIARPRKQQQQQRPVEEEEYVEIVQLPKKDKTKARFKKVSVKHVKTVEEPEYVEEDFNTNHFYQ